MAGFAAAGVVMGAVSLISGFLGSKKASKAAKEQARITAEHETEITAERQRQINKEERQYIGSTLAGYAGGGVRVGQASLSGGPQPSKTSSVGVSALFL